MESDARIRKAEEDLPTLLASDLTCDQIVEKMAGRPILQLAASNAHRLSLEMLKMAISDLMIAGSNSPKNRRNMWESAQWVVTEYAVWKKSPAPDVTSFEGACELLGINAALAARVMLNVETRDCRKRVGRIRPRPVIAAKAAPVAASGPPKKRGRRKQQPGNRG